MSNESITTVVDLGAAAISVGGVGLGHTDEKGVKVSVKHTLVTAKAGKFGETPVKKFINGQMVEVEFSMIQTDLSLLLSALPGASLVSGSGLKRLTFGKIAGSALTGVNLTLTPYLSANAPAFNLNIPNAVPIGEFEITYDGSTDQKFKCKFEGMINEGATDGNYLFNFGDPAATADAVASVVLTVVPADAAVGVGVGSTVVWTFDKKIDPNTISSSNVLLFKDPTGVGPTGLGVAGTITLDATQLILTFTPSSPLSAATEYNACLNRVKDINGNLVASGLYASNFTTA